MRGIRWTLVAVLAIAGIFVSDASFGQSAGGPRRPLPTPATQPEPSAAPSIIVIGPAARPDKHEQDLTPTSQPANSAPAVPTSDEIMQGLLGDDPNVGRGNSPQDVIGNLLPAGPSKPVAPAPPGRGSENKSVEPVKPDAKNKLLPDRYVLVERVGHLVRDRGRWLFAFEADKSAAGDPPLILLPNSLLEAMQQQANYGKQNIKFRVSGEVTQYQETNYLLLRKVLVEHNMDRF